MSVNRTNRKYSAGKGAEDKELLQKQFEDCLRQGMTIPEALTVVGRSRSTYETWRRDDRVWAEKINVIRTHASDVSLREVQVEGFAEFSKTYLKTRVFPHMMNVVDLIEGRDPSWLHPSFQFEPGSSGPARVLVNVPPNHGKSMSITINYATYRICKDPNVRIIIVSKTQEQAKKFLYAIKQRLTHPNYADLQLAFGPVDGWKDSADQWSATKVYLGGGDGQEKDPTLEALGMGGQIYGARADLIIVDDAVTLSNAGEWPKQMDWLRQEVGTRLGPDGQLLVVGTRVASQDLYRALRDTEHYADAEVPWTYMGMPAVLESGERNEDWVTLWPVSDLPFTDRDVQLPDGTYPRWTGARMARIRNEVGPVKWSMVYQQMDVEENSTFDPVCVRGSVDGMRKPGVLRAGLPGHPENPDGFYRICAMDPAIVGDMAVVAYAVDRESGKRYVLDMLVKTAPRPSEIREVFTSWTEMYSPQEWIVEDNAFQGFLAQDEEIRSYLSSRGVIMRSHHTGSNKMDPDFGVASMASLFGTSSPRSDGRGSTHNKDNLIQLPDLTNSFGVKTLVEQLTVWSPKVKTKNRKQDTVMALWFAELRAREVLHSSQGRSLWFGNSSFVSDRDMDSRMVIALDDWASANPVQYL